MRLASPDAPVAPINPTASAPLRTVCRIDSFARSKLSRAAPLSFASIARPRTDPISKSSAMVHRDVAWLRSLYACSPLRVREIDNLASREEPSEGAVDHRRCDNRPEYRRASWRAPHD